MKNHFVFFYAGNKREEVEKIFNNIDLNNIETIVEPFCGSSALSYYISTIHPKKYKYILNDSNKLLIDLYKILQDKDATTDFEKVINEKAKRIIDKASYDKEIANYKTDIYDYYISMKIHSIRQCLYKIGYIYKYIKLNDSPIVNFLQTENITLTNKDAIEYLNDYKKNNTVLLFLDPPYIMSDNDWYNMKTTNTSNIYEFLYENNINKFKCKILLVLELNWIIKMLFKKYIKTTYDKVYQTKHNTTTHCIIHNY